MLQATATGAYYSQNDGYGQPSSAYHYAANTNYSAMTCGNYGCMTLLGPEENARNFFVFNLSGVSGRILFATLSIGNGPSGANASRDYMVWDVTTSISDLEANHPVGDSGSALAIYQDLGSGIQYGQVVVGPEDNGALIEIPFDLPALLSLDAAEGGSWAVGGSVVPEPASWVMMLIGFGTIAYGGYRRNMGRPAARVSARPVVVTLKVPALRGS
jgi:hypothetical protein